MTNDFEHIGAESEIKELIQISPDEIYIENIGDEEANYYIASHGETYLASGRDKSQVEREAWKKINLK